jgi:hypothetical protein
VVRHSNIIPPQFLPTFNSNVVESFVWRIRELAERFVYFNDDMYVLRPTHWSAFFDPKAPHNPINRHEPGARDHAIVADHPIPHVAMWVNATQHLGLHNTRLAHNVLPYRKSQVRKTYVRFRPEALRAARNTFRTGSTDMNILRFTTALTTTSGANPAVQTSAKEDWFAEGDDVQRIRRLPRLRPLPRFACINNSQHFYSHIYDTLRQLFPKASVFETGVNKKPR